MNSLTVVIYYDPFGVIDATPGAWRAKIKEVPGIHGAGATATQAFVSVRRTAHSLDKAFPLSGEKYKVEVDLASLPSNKQVAKGLAV
jgi:hypothetical protein